MALKDCLYTIEDHPELLAAFKADLQDGTTHFPSYLKTLTKNLAADKKQVQLDALGIKNDIGYIESFVSRTKGQFDKRLGVRLKPEVAKERAYIRGINNLIATHYDLGPRKSGSLSLEGEGLRFNAKYQTKIAEMMNALKPRKVGFEHSVHAQDQLIDGLYGSTTDVDAKSYAKALTETFNDMLDDFNSYGGRMEKLDTYRLPQTSDAKLVANADEAVWKKDVLDTVDLDQLNKQVELLLGKKQGAVITKQEIDIALSEMYRSSSTDGASAIVPRARTSGLRSDVSKRHTDHRFLHFKDAKSWKKYNKLYGAETPYVAITNHIEQMSKEIAAMKVFGANPEKNLTYLMSYVDKRVGRVGASAEALQLYKTQMGELDGIPHPKTAAVLSGARDIMVGTKLGKATIAAMSDNVFLGRMAQLTEIPMYKMYSRLFSQLAPGNEADRVFAGQIGMAMDYALDKLHSIHRIGLSNNNNWTAKFADASLRLTGLNYWTQAVEYTFKLEFAQQLGNKMSKSFDELGPLREIMEAYGITAKDWGVLRDTPLTSYKKSKYFDVTAIKDDDVMAKIQGLILSETAMAAPRPTLRVRKALHGDQTATSSMGIARRTFFQFKGFPVSIMMNQWGREFSQNTMASKTLGFGSLLVGTSVIGMLSYNLKQISDGKTPMAWNDPELMYNGVIQGGMLSLVGDGLFMDPDKPEDLLDYAAGPVVGEGLNLLNDFLLKPAKDLYEESGKAMEHAAVAAIRTAERNMPVPLSLPVMKTIVTRATTNQLSKMVDPNYRSKQRRVTRRLKKDRGQSQWWKPGEMTPDF